MSEAAARIQAASAFHASLAETAKHNRELVQEMTVFAKDEAARFFHHRMERNSAALEKLSACHSLPALFEMQQGWLRDLMQDYGAENLRMAGMMRDLTEGAVGCAGEMADGHLAALKQAGEQAVTETQAAAEQVQETAETAQQG